MPSHYNQEGDGFVQSAIDFTRQIIKGRDKLGASSQRKLDKFRDFDIDGVKIVRKPITKGIVKLANKLTKGEFKREMLKNGYDDLFHLRVDLKLKGGPCVTLEKNETVTISRGKCERLNEDGLEAMELEVKKPRTLGEAYDRMTKGYPTAKNLYDYDSVKNNCQKFTDVFLTKNKDAFKYTAEDRKFVKQDVKFILDKYMELKKGAKLVTNLAQRLSLFLTGAGDEEEGKEKKKRVKIRVVPDEGKEEKKRVKIKVVPEEKKRVKIKVVKDKNPMEDKIMTLMEDYVMKFNNKSLEDIAKRQDTFDELEKKYVKVQEDQIKLYDELLNLRKEFYRIGGDTAAAIWIKTRTDKDKKIINDYDKIEKNFKRNVKRIFYKKGREIKAKEEEGKKISSNNIQQEDMSEMMEGEGLKRIAKKVFKKVKKGMTKKNIEKIIKETEKGIKTAKEVKKVYDEVQSLFGKSKQDGKGRAKTLRKLQKQKEKKELVRTKKAKKVQEAKALFEKREAKLARKMAKQDRKIGKLERKAQRGGGPQAVGRAGNPRSMASNRNIHSLLFK